eukprot:SM005029S17648  [mRNA]  locus=s5029:101:969:- [translate_table: standard]
MPPPLGGVAGALAAKQRRHRQFLDFLASSGCLAALQGDDGVLLDVLEHGEKLAALAALRAFHNARSSEWHTAAPHIELPDLLRCRRQPPLLGSEEAGSTGALLEIMHRIAARRQASASVAALVAVDQGEAFYVRATCAGDLFDGSAADVTGRGSVTVAEEAPSFQ